MSYVRPDPRISQISEEQLQQIRMATNGNYVLGNSKFQREIANALKRRVIPAHAGRPKK